MQKQLPGNCKSVLSNQHPHNTSGVDCLTPFYPNYLWMLFIYAYSSEVMSHVFVPKLKLSNKCYRYSFYAWGNSSDCTNFTPFHNFSFVSCTQRNRNISCWRRVVKWAKSKVIKVRSDECLSDHVPQALSLTASASVQKGKQQGAMFSHQTVIDMQHEDSTWVKDKRA